ncbi:hypothetical protein J132_09440 [Termitomyces sp. J132]|nr:hypothetical protein J132_09440 [Termitomyces sp. J132]
MASIGPFPESKEYNYLWVVICCMSSNTTMMVLQLSWVYMQEIVRLHSLLSSIVSNRDSKFISNKLLGV